MQFVWWSIKIGLMFGIKVIANNSVYWLCLMFSLLHYDLLVSVLVHFPITVCQLHLTPPQERKLLTVFLIKRLVCSVKEQQKIRPGLKSRLFLIQNSTNRPSGYNQEMFSRQDKY